MRTLCGMVMLFVMAACTATALPELEIIAHGQQCTPSQPGARLLLDAAGVREATQQSLDANVDAEHLILVAMGTQPTPGYALELGEVHAPRDGALQLPVLYQRPPSDAILAQMLTTPCAVVAVGRSPRVAALKVPLFDGGTTRIELPRHKR